MAVGIMLEYFAWVRERIGVSAEQLDVETSLTIAELLDQLAARGGVYADVLAERDKIRFAVNENYAGETCPVHPGDRLAIFPPVTGG